MGNIASVIEVGDELTYDLEIDHPDHQFYLSNGMLTSNSHSYSYAIDSFMCAYLETYHEAEWLCSYLESQMGNADTRGTAIATVKSFGYEIGKVDINLSTDRWVIAPDGKTLVPPLLSVKGVGMSAVEEIIANRPYRTVEDLCWDANGKWRHSKFNKKSMENLIMVGAFGSMCIVGPAPEGERPGTIRFRNWRHMHAVLIDNQELLRKRFGPELLPRLAPELSDVEEWSNAERGAFHRELVGDLNVDFILDPVVQARLADRDVRSVDDMQEGTKAIAWFVLVEAKHLVTKKNGRPYVMAIVAGPSGTTHRINVWGAGPDVNLQLNTAYIAELERNDYGLSTRINQVRRL
mgnify:CR=1 FL=1